MDRCSQCNALLPEGAAFCTECGTRVGREDEQAAGSVMETVSGLKTLPPEAYDDDGPGRGKHGEDKRLVPGDEIAGKFRIDGLLGEGGMGTVYKATEIQSGEPAAVKLIASRYVASEKAVERLIAEGVTTRRIAHPNIVRIYDIGLHGSQPYIAMEYIDGEPLQVWRGRKMARIEDVPVFVAGQIIKEILNGLEAAHDAGVIHRDLKPENIMLIGEPDKTSAGVRIVDFGIALATRTATQSGSGTGLGTQLYMAPEQIRNANAANAAADLYSVSKIFYELIVGVLPTGHWQPPSDGRSDVPPGIDVLIERGLSVNRDNRPQSAAEYRTRMIDAFNGVVWQDPKGSGKKSGQDDPRKRKTGPTPPPPKNKGVGLWLGLGGAGLLGLVLIGMVAASLNRSAGTGCAPGLIDYNGNCLSPTAYSKLMGREDDGRDDVDDDDDEGEVNPPPPPPPMDYASLGGQWADGQGLFYSISMNRGGRFNGQTTLPDGTPISISGNFDGMAGNYVLRNSYSGESYDGSVTWDGGCHIAYTTFLPNGSAGAQGQFHVNHMPGAPCP